MISFNIVVFFFNFVFSSSINDWNFNGLTTDNYYETNYSSYIYRFNFRKVLPTDTQKNCTSTNCVLEEISMFSASWCYCYGNISTEEITIFPDDSAINFTYHSNSPSGGVATHGHFKLDCSNGNPIAYEAKFSSYDVYVNITAPQGCKGYGVEKKKKGGGIGFGAVFFIIILILVFLYFAIGIAISYFVLHKSGLELFIPGFTYIVEFFHCVVAGVKFIINSIKKLVSGSGGGGISDGAYSKI